MCKCDVCGTKQEKIGEYTLSIGGKDLVGGIPYYNIDLLTYIQGKNICNGCMNTYHKIHALISGVNFSCGGVDYYADGRNL